MAISAKDMRLLAACLRAVRRTCADASVILFGSRARGKAGPDSDMDLLVLIPDEVDVGAREDEILRSLYVLSVEADVVITALVYTRSSWNNPPRRATPFWQAVTAEGVPA